MLKGIQMQYQGIKTYLEENKNNDTINQTWQCYTLNVKKIVSQIFHLNLMMFDHLESAVPRSLKQVYQQILSDLKIFLNNKPKTDQKDDLDYYEPYRDYDQVDEYLNNRPVLQNKIEQRGDLFKFLMESQQKQKNNQLFLKQIPVYNKANGTDKLLRIKSSTLDISNPMLARPQNKEVQTQFNISALKEMINKYLSQNDGQNKHDYLFNQVMTICHSKIQNPTNIFTNFMKIMPKSLEFEVAKRRIIKELDTSYQKTQKQSIQNATLNSNKSQKIKNSHLNTTNNNNNPRYFKQIKKQGKKGLYKKKDSKRTSLYQEQMRSLPIDDKIKDKRSRQLVADKQSQRNGENDNRNSLQKEFQKVLKKYCGSSDHIDKSQASTERRTDSQTMPVFDSNNKLVRSTSKKLIDSQQKMTKLLQKQKNQINPNKNLYNKQLPIIQAQNNEHDQSIGELNLDSNIQKDQDSLGQLQLDSNIKSSGQSDNKTYQSSNFDKSQKSCNCAHKRLSDGVYLSHQNSKNPGFSPQNIHGQAIENVDSIVINNENISYYKNSQEVADKVKERQKMLSNKEEKRYEIQQNVYFHMTSNKGGFKRHPQLNKSQEKYLPKIQKKKASENMRQFMKKAYQNSPYTQSIVNYNKQMMLSKNTSLPSFNNKSQHYNDSQYMISQKNAHPSQHGYANQFKKAKGLIISDENHLLQHEANLMKDINEFGQHKNIKSGEWIKIMNKIKNYELIHKGFCGQNCIHLIKFNEFLKNNKNKLYLHRKQMQVHKKDIMFS